MSNQGKDPRRSRWAGFGLAVAFLLGLTGDGIGQGATALGGIDPLEVLDLKVKPNVGIILDTSGSMAETVLGNGVRSDFKFSKMYQAKQVLNQVITDNQTEVNFLFATYKFSADPTWNNCPGGNCNAQNQIVNLNMPADGARFQYATQSWAAVGALPIEGPSPGMGAAASEAVMNRLYAWQWIQNTPPVQNNLLRISEAGSNCTATIAPGFYNATTIGPAIKAALEACGASANTYTVTYTAASGVFTITRATGTGTISLLWTDPLTTFDGPTRMTANQTGGTTYNTNDARINLLQRVSGDRFTENRDPDGTGPSPARNITSYYLYAQKLWNGEIIQVDGTGLACNILPGTPTSPDPTVTLQRVSSCATPTVVSTNVFTWSGGTFAGAGGCQAGFNQRVPLFRCDASPANIQSSTIAPFLRNELPLNGTGGITGYSERPDGTGTIVTPPSAGGVNASGNTPMAQSVDGFRWLYGGYPGVAPAPPAAYLPNPLPAAQGLWQAGQSLPFPNNISAISTHPDPKERTILLLVTDGDQNCAPFSPISDAATWGAAMATQRLYDPAANGTGGGTVNADGSINGDIAASVTTYVIGFGNGGQVNRLNWIAWGGSGMRRTGGNVGTTSGIPTWTNIPSAVERAACKTCQDAFIAPDAETLAAQLQAIIDQGPSTGEFTAQQAVFTSVYELVKEVTPGSPLSPPDDFDPDAPNTRYNASVPNLFRSTFSMPGFKGQFRAVQGGGVGVTWNAGQKLYDRVNNALLSCNEGGGGLAGECRFASLLTRIDRRIYTSSGNGVFPATVSNLTDDNWLTTNGNRTILWPTPTSIAPQDNTSAGLLDAALGLPATVDTDLTNATFNSLQATYGACAGSNLAAACSAALPARTQRARREARERILAHMAGAQVVLDNLGFPKHINAGVNQGGTLYYRRDWVLADSTLATPAVVGPPIEPEPTLSGFEAEYLLFRDGFRDGNGQATGDGTRIGFGLRNPDRDSERPVGDTRPAPFGGTGSALKPAMTVAYVAANDMLHAFRAGPNCGVPPYTGAGCNERGGEELWGFVPYDQLDKLRQLLVVQTRANHTYMLAAAVRFADVFVPNPGTAGNPSGATTTLSVGTATQSVLGVWRRVMVFGRGIGGKFLTALDITTPGEYMTLAANTVPPVVLWNRGNPDALDPEYAEMGQTWSVPAISFVDRAPHTTNRKPSGVDFVLHLGSGYGDTTGCPNSTPCEGQTFFTLDALTGDVIAAARIPAAGSTPDGGYANSLVANAVGYNPTEFTAQSGDSVHPAGRKQASDPKVERVYIGDLHGRLWKILTSAPDTPVLVTDLGIEQPIATPVSLLSFEDPPSSGTFVPYVYVTSGNDRRQNPNSTGEAFLVAGIKDATTVALSPPDACAQSPVVAPCLFARQMTQVVSGVTGYFRGTVQPTTFLTQNTPPLGRVFFVGTRFNPPAPLGAPFSPDPEPCKSSFDSIVYALGAKTGEAAFDLNDDAAADDASVILDNSKLVGIYIVAAPSTTGSGDSQTQLMLDEGLNRTTGGGVGNNCQGGEGPDCIPGGGPAPGTMGSGGVLAAGYRPSSTICQ